MGPGGGGGRPPLGAGAGTGATNPPETKQPMIGKLQKQCKALQGIPFKEQRIFDSIGAYN